MADLVLEKAQVIRSDERRAFLQAIEIAVHNGVSSAFRA